MSRYADLAPEILDAIAAAGFDVYQPDARCKTWLFYSDGVNLAYLQRGEWGGLSISTVHIPNRESGTGFRITEDRDPPLGFTREELARGFVTAPNWASTRDRESVRKWPSVEAWLKSTITPYTLARKGTK